MKRLLYLLTMLFGGFATSYGQECAAESESDLGADPTLCKQNVSLYSEFLKQKNYKDARIYWVETQKVCPKFKSNLYANGTYIFGKLAKEAPKGSKQEKNFVDTLFIIYDQWIENFGDCADIQIDRADDIMSYRSENVEEAYKLYDKAINVVKKPKGSSIQRFMQAGYARLQAGTMDCSQLIELFERLEKICDQRVADGDTKYTEIKEVIAQYAEPCMTCEMLEQVYKKKLTDAPNDTDLMKTALSKLEAKKCEEIAYYFELVKKLDEIQPSFESKQGIGNTYAAAKDYKNAKIYYNQAVELTSDEEAKKGLYEKLATIALINDNYSEARSLARKLDACKANAIHAKAIGSNAVNCGSNNAQRSIAYSLALDYAEKACGEVSSSYINSWKGRLLPKSELFMQGFEAGKEYQDECYKESTVLRSKD